MTDQQRDNLINLYLDSARDLGESRVHEEHSCGEDDTTECFISAMAKYNAIDTCIMLLDLLTDDLRERKYKAYDEGVDTGESFYNIPA